MNEQDLEQASEIYRKRRFVQASLDAVIKAESQGLEEADLNLTFSKSACQHARATLDAHAAREVCKLARKLLEDQLRDIDASLRAFGCDPPNPEPVLRVRQGETRK